MDIDHMQSAENSKGFAQVFRLDPRIAFLAFVVDIMLFGGELMSLGLLVPMALAVGIVLGFITYRAQIKWYGDDRETALIKGFIVGLLTAIPAPLPAVVAIPAGIVGLIHTVQKRWARLGFRSDGSAR
jgi:hypothetical protein